MNFPLDAIMSVMEENMKNPDYRRVVESETPFVGSKSLNAKSFIRQLNRDKLNYEREHPFTVEEVFELNRPSDEQLPTVIEMSKIRRRDSSPALKRSATRRRRSKTLTE